MMYFSTRRTIFLMGTALVLATPQLAAAQDAPTDEQATQAKKDTDNWNVLKAKAEAEKAAYDAEKTKSEAKAAAAKAAFGPLGDIAGAEGKTTPGTDAGKLEGQLLSSVAAQKAAADISSAVKKIEGDRIFVLAGDEALNFDVLDSYNAKRRAVEIAIDAQASLCTIKPPPGDDVKFFESIVAAAPVAAIGAAIDLAARLFRTDFAVSNLDISPDDVLLARSVAGKLAGKTVIVPSLITAPSFSQGNAVYEGFVGLEARHATLVNCINKLSAKPASKPPARKDPKKDSEAEAARKDAIAKLTAVSKRFDDFVTAVTTANEKGIVEIAAAARQQQLRTSLQGASILRVHMHTTGGTLYTAKNFWTTFGAPIFHVTGGTAVSYVLADAATGTLKASGTLVCSSGFHTAKQVHARRDEKLLAKPQCWTEE